MRARQTHTRMTTRIMTHRQGSKLSIGDNARLMDKNFFRQGRIHGCQESKAFAIGKPLDRPFDTGHVNRISIVGIGHDCKN